MAEKNTNTWLDTPDPQVFIKNSARFNDLMMMYRCTVREVRTKLEVLNDEFSVEYKRNPISFIKTRIKKPESIYKKLKKLGYDFTAENIQNQLNDVGLSSIASISTGNMYGSRQDCTSLMISSTLYPSSRTT